ncbi:MAG: hypothetical protein AB7Q29_14910 [Vicinamibacterales bacterium]
MATPEAAKRCNCNRGPVRQNQRTCKRCHAELMVHYRRQQREELARLRALVLPGEIRA